MSCLPAGPLSLRESLPSHEPLHTLCSVSCNAKSPSYLVSRKYPVITEVNNCTVRPVPSVGSNDHSMRVITRRHIKGVGGSNSDDGGDDNDEDDNDEDDNDEDDNDEDDNGEDDNGEDDIDEDDNDEDDNDEDDNDDDNDDKDMDDYDGGDYASCVL
ncbi:hypothetical protein DPEC_G00277840 [Dallia pectoralis]|uniref:Uncharacterized protein n=1 Tax=Dallia pectoralis TaxID=75939 RepID=A0ACC2FM18_DALPE|nr:hypothetical protein DPEC_G00277840 [Dallia pectoralis]